MYFFCENRHCGRFIPNRDKAGRYLGECDFCREQRANAEIIRYEDDRFKEMCHENNAQDTRDLLTDSGWDYEGRI